VLHSVGDFGPGTATISSSDPTESEISICLCDGFSACLWGVISLWGVILSEGLCVALIRNGLFDDSWHSLCCAFWLADYLYGCEIGLGT